MASKTRKRTWVVSVSKRPKGNYIQVGYQKLQGTGYETRFAIGYEQDFEQFQEGAIEKIKMLIKDIPLTTPKEEIIEIIEEKIKNNKEDLLEYRKILKGYELVSSLIDYFDIFKDFDKDNSISLKEIVMQHISQRIKNPLSILGSFDNEQNEEEFTYSKNSFFGSLDYIHENRHKILKSLNSTLVNEYERDLEVIQYGCVTAYFETYSQEEKILIGMTTDSNGIPIHYETFEENVIDKNTFSNFVSEMQELYNIKQITIVANKNIYFNTNIDSFETMGKTKRYYIYRSNNKDLNSTQNMNLFTKHWYVEENLRILKNNLDFIPMNLRTWKHFSGYICLCFLSLAVMKFLVFKINDLLGLSKKEKFTEHKLKEMMKDVISIEEKFNGKTIKTINLKNASVEDSWNDYDLVKKVLEMIKK